MNPAEKKAVDTIRVLCADTVQKANSGHPGTPMSMAPLTYLLYNEQMKYDPANPNWLNRDRFVLSIGHASALLYAILHVSGVAEIDKNGDKTGRAAVTMDDLKSFRQLGSRCAGHPEYGHVTGVEMTTGPLGQGVASSVGMAIALKWLAARYNKPNFTVFDANVYALCGDGCMMEGVTSEAASLAGTLKLDNLCWIYDDNDITIEGDTSLAFTENVKQRFEAYGFDVQNVADVNDLDALRKALGAQASSLCDRQDACPPRNGKPTLIIAKSKIAYGAPKMQGSHEAHGAPLGDAEIQAAKAFFGLPTDLTFYVPEDVYLTFKNGIAKNGVAKYAAWEKMYAEYRKAYPELASELDLMQKGELPANWDSAIEAFPADPKGIASRISSGKVLNQIAKNVPWMLGGSADLAPSNKTELTFQGAGVFSADNWAGRNFHFGVREHGMAAIANGMSLCGLRSYCATFFVFADYMRPSIRLSALMQIPTMYIYTHDSIGVGEDGPTHQPVEHLASLRAIPNLLVLRPSDANEVAECYKIAVQQKKTPSVLIFTRQNLPTIDRTKYAAASGTQKGAYILAEFPSTEHLNRSLDLILIGTGSEIGLCLTCYERLVKEGMNVRVVSMPCWELFEQQSREYKDSVLPPNVTARVGVELGIEMGWAKYIGPKGAFLGINDFGASGPANVLMSHFGFTVENMCRVAKSVLQ